MTTKPASAKTKTKVRGKPAEAKRLPRPPVVIIDDLLDGLPVPSVPVKLPHRTQEELDSLLDDHLPLEDGAKRGRPKMSTELKALRQYLKSIAPHAPAPKTVEEGHKLLRANSQLFRAAESMSKLDMFYPFKVEGKGTVSTILGTHELRDANGVLFKRFIIIDNDLFVCTQKNI